MATKELLIRQCPECGSGDVNWCGISHRAYCNDCGYWAPTNFGSDEDAIRLWNQKLKSVAESTPAAKTDRIALIDMDGTIADYDRAMMDAYDALLAPGELSFAEATRKYGRDEWPDYLWNRMDVIKRKPGFWRDLLPYEIGFEIIQVLDRHKFDLHIATQGPSTKSQAWAEKLDWAREWLPDADVHVTEKKSLLYGKILVDDWPPFGLEWLENRPRGLVVMPAHHYNEDIEHPQILRYSLGMQDQLEERIAQLV